MKYVIAPNNIFVRYAMAWEVIDFSDRCKTTPKKLTEEESMQYGVSRLKLTTPPEFDPLLQERLELDPILTDGIWVQRWKVSNINPAKARERWLADHGVVSMAQARLALMQSGKLASIDTAIAAMPEPDKSSAMVLWEYSTIIRRSDPLVQSLATAIGLTSAQVDDLFLLAGTL